MIPLAALQSFAWTVLIPLVDEVPDPEDVKPGWLGFGVFLLLAAALVVLFFSFRKQLRKVDFEEKPDQDPGTGTSTTGEGSDNGSDKGPVAPPG